MNSPSTNKKKKSYSILTGLVVYAFCAASLVAGQVALAFLPNVEIVSLLIMVYTVVFGWKVLYSVYVFAFAEFLLYGFHIWSINYLYVWTILVALTMLVRRQRFFLLYAVLSGGFGLFFGTLCAPPNLVFGVKFFIAYLVSNIPFDLIHCVGNFVLALALFYPLRWAVEKAAAQLPLSVYEKKAHPQTVRQG